jgi:hypothetical protein
MEPNNSQATSENTPGMADLEQPVQELTAEEADQVQGGVQGNFIGTSAGGMLTTAPSEPTTLKVKMSDAMISS